MTGTLHEDQYTFMIISRSFLLGMRNVSDKSRRENQNTYFVFSNFFFENRALCEIMWRNILRRGRPHKTIWRMPITCRIPKPTNTHSEYAIRIPIPLHKCCKKAPQRTSPVLLYICSLKFKKMYHFVKENSFYIIKDIYVGRFFFLFSAFYWCVFQNRHNNPRSPIRCCRLR
jgi:hypothetical protein